MAYSDDEYEFVSKESLNNLHQEIGKLKQGGMKELVAKDEDLHKSIKGLTSTLNSLIDVFHDAALEMKLEDTESTALKDKLGPIESKLEILIEQNKKIAQGLVAITDAVQTKFDEIEDQLGMNKNNSARGGSFMPPEGMPPMPPEGMPPMPPQGMPPMPPQGMPPMPPEGMPPMPPEGMPPMPPQGMPPMPPSPEEDEDFNQKLQNTFGSYSNK